MCIEMAIVGGFMYVYMYMCVCVSGGGEGGVYMCVCGGGGVCRHIPHTDRLNIMHLVLIV